MASCTGVTKNAEFVRCNHLLAVWAYLVAPFSNKVLMYVDMQGLVDHCWCDGIVLLVLVLSDGSAASHPHHWSHLWSHWQVCKLNPAWKNIFHTLEQRRCPCHRYWPFCRTSSGCISFLASFDPTNVFHLWHTSTFILTSILIYPRPHIFSLEHHSVLHLKMNPEGLFCSSSWCTRPAGLNTSFSPLLSSRGLYQHIYIICIHTFFSTEDGSSMFLECQQHNPVSNSASTQKQEQH